MKAALLLLAVCLLVVVVPTTSEAHVGTCVFGDVQCTLQCIRDHVHTAPPHSCRFIVP